MEFPVEIWLRGENHAVTDVIAPVAREPRSWTETDVAEVLIGMLRAMDRAKNPEEPHGGAVALRGFSWIVNPFDDGVVIALEMTLGAVVAGPFDITERELSDLIEGAVATGGASSEQVH
jgi:hypothetical protein